MSKSNSGVISFRTNQFDELKELANSKSVSVSSLLEDIVQKYLQYHRVVEERHYLGYPRDTISALYDAINSEEDIRRIHQITFDGYVKELNFVYSDPSFDDISNNMQVWFENNKIPLRKITEKNNVKFSCKHEMGKKWSIAISKIILEVYEKFGYRGILGDVDVNHFTYIIKKIKKGDQND